MLNNHKPQATIGRHGAEKVLQRLQSTRRSTDTNNWKYRRIRYFFVHKLLNPPFLGMVTAIRRLSAADSNILARIVSAALNRVYSGLHDKPIAAPDKDLTKEL